MNKLTLYFAAFVMAVMTMVACSQEFLDAPAQGALDADILSDQNGVEAALIAAYSMLDGFANFGGWAAAGSNNVLGSMASDDAYKGSEPGDQQPMTDVELYQWSTGNVTGYFNDKWRVLYEAVSRCNAVLSLMANVEGISPDDITRIEGETRFLRAHYHFDAFKVWKNVPYYTEADEDFRKPNNVDIMPLIQEDMQAAIDKLPESQGQVGRVTKWTAKAYMGKIKIWNKEWTEAKTLLDDVVNNGPYDLRDCFHDAFSASEENGPETVLAYQASSNDGDGGGSNGNRNDRLNFPHSGSPFGCCGFHQPSQNLVNAYKVKDDGTPFLDGSFNDSDVTVDDYVDPRLDWTVGRDDVPYLDWGPHGPSWIRDRAWAGPYSPKKNVYEQGSGVGSQVGWAPYQLHSMNMHLLRYADVLLLLAEAEAELGNLGRARELVNMIRERAGNCAQGPDGVAVEVPIDDAGITWANYKVEPYANDFASKDEALDAIRMERRLELAMEGHRFFDLRRWGIAKQVLNDYIEVEKTKRNYLTGASPYEDRHDLYPLPIEQIELSTVDGEQRLVQNTGW